MWGWCRLLVCGLGVLLVVLGLTGSVRSAVAAEKDYITYVSVVRGREFWRVGKENWYLEEQRGLLERYKIGNTWLLQYDALLDGEIVERVKADDKSEKGLFVEVTAKLAKKAYVNYQFLTEKWERADKLFLSGYGREERVRLIDEAVRKFEENFGYTPKSIGVWYIDGWSLQYLRDRYGVEVVLGLADQYSTDGYQVWGQYVGEPYYPSRLDVQEPAANQAERLDVVKLQWAAREPLLSYGRSGEFSNYSVQVNDYYRYHRLGAKYFRGLVETYTKNVSGKVAQVTLGLEVGELERKYWQGWEEQIRTLAMMGVESVTMSEFARVYRQTYPEVSPEYKISSRVGNREMVWYMSPYYRAAILAEGDRRYLVDLRVYHQSRYFDNDQLVADRRENLYRVVPAIVDEVALGSRVEVTGMEVELGRRRIMFERDPGLRERVTKFDAGQTERRGEYVLEFPERVGAGKEEYGIIPWGDRIKLVVSRVVPDVVASKLDGKWLVGIRTGSEDFWGLDTRDMKIGRRWFEYPLLESFVGVKRKLRGEVRLVGRQEDQIARFVSQGEVVKKGVKYGNEKILEEARKKKVFENGYYMVVIKE